MSNGFWVHAEDYEIKSLGSWLFVYWYLIVFGLFIAGGIVFAVYIHQTRMHSITLYHEENLTVIPVQHNSAFSIPLPKTDKKFLGWYRDSAYTIPFCSSDKIKFDFPLYAKFE